MFQNLVTLPIFFSPQNPGKLICNVIMVGHKRRLIVKLRSSRFSCYTSQWGAFNSFLDSFMPRNNKAVKFFWKYNCQPKGYISKVKLQQTPSIASCHITMVEDQQTRLGTWHRSILTQNKDGKEATSSLRLEPATLRSTGATWCCSWQAMLLALSDLEWPKPASCAWHSSKHQHLTA